MRDRVSFASCITTTDMAATMRRYFCGWKRVKIMIISAVALFVLINSVVAILVMSRRHGSNIAPTAIGYAHKLMDHSSDPTKYISIEVLSSKDRVRICVDDATVIDDSGPSNNRGLHVVVLNQRTGMVMAQRVFDTYMDDEPLVAFLYRVSAGRILIFAVKDEASYHLTPLGRRAIQIHVGGNSNSATVGGSAVAGGSLWLPELSWRDMWAMVAAKHHNQDDNNDNGSKSDENGSYVGRVYGESFSRNPIPVVQNIGKNVASSSWGSDVLLRVQVPLEINNNNQNDEWCESWITTADAEDSTNGSNNDSEDNSSNIDDNDNDDNNLIVESQLSRRRRFCSRIEGYGDVCSCTSPAAPLNFHPLSIPNSNIDQVPVIIVAGNRADYLFRTLKSVLNAHGVRRPMVTVHVDGYYDEPVEVARLLGVRAVQHMPAAVGDGNGNRGQSGFSNSDSSTLRRRRVTQHYKTALSSTFGALYPHAQYAIVLEDDLEVSVDFFSFFSQTLPLLTADDDTTEGNNGESLYCVSAWNDQGYEHTASRPDVLYRVDWMPGLGWMLKRSLFKDQLESDWPTVEKPWDWDMWMRADRVRRGRQCIVPEISRTYHFGAERAVNVNPYFQRAYFGQHAFYNVSTSGSANSVINELSGGTGGEYDSKLAGGLINFKDIEKMTGVAYLEWMEHRILTEGRLLDHSQWPCRRKSWKSRNSGSFSDGWLRYGSNYRRGVEEFFAIEDMINDDDAEKLFLLYIQMDEPSNGNKNAASVAWTPLAKCLGIWDLDIRGHYKGIWRLYLNNHQFEDNRENNANEFKEQGKATAALHSKSGTELFIIGCPFSYFCKFKPVNLTSLVYKNNDSDDNDYGVGGDHGPL